jgi:hypothetical protein
MTARNVKPHLDADESAALHALGWHPSVDATACPDSALLRAAAEDAFGDAAHAARIRTHGETCATCRILLADLSTVLSEEPGEDERRRILARIKAGQKAQPTRARWWITSVGLAATAATLAFLLIPWGSLNGGEAPEVPRSGGSGSVATAPAPSIFTGGRPVIPRPEPELTLRGDQAPVPVAEQIGQALDEADAGRLPEALSRLQVIAGRNPSSGDAQLALGATLLRADRPAEARPALEQARSLKGTASSDEFDWFLAVALARSTETARAAAVLEPLCARNTMRGAMACAGLAEIRKQQ